MKLSVAEATPLLSELLDKKKLIIFCGTGISVTPPSNLPTWDTFLEKFVEWVDRIHHSLPPEKQFQDTLQAARDSYKTDPLRSAYILKQELLKFKKDPSLNVYDSFRRWITYLMQGQPNENHNLIVSTNYKYILTSNYDELLEAAARDLNYSNLESNSFSMQHKQRLAVALYAETPSIIHVHGDMQGIALDNFVFTAKDYADIKKANFDFDALLKSLFIHNSALFVGYGGSDPHLEDIIEEVSGFFEWQSTKEMPRYFMTLKKDKIKRVTEKYKNNLRTDLIELDDYPQATDLLRNLQASHQRPH